MRGKLAVLLLCLASVVHADVTVYYVDGVQPSQGAVPGQGTYTGEQAFNPIVLAPPPIPSPPPPTYFDVRLQDGNPAALSIKHSGTFFGFSVDFAVASQICACPASILRPPSPSDEITS
jgi:hypothetical protein